MAWWSVPCSTSLYRAWSSTPAVIHVIYGSTCYKRRLTKERTTMFDLSPGSPVASFVIGTVCHELRASNFTASRYISAGKGHLYLSQPECYPYYLFYFSWRCHLKEADVGDMNWCHLTWMCWLCGMSWCHLTSMCWLGGMSWCHLTSMCWC